MPALTITKTYLNGNILTQTDLDNAFNSISTLLNTTLLDYQNVQTGGLIGANLANGAITSLQMASGSVGQAQLQSSAVTLSAIDPSAVSGIATMASSAVLGSLASSTAAIVFGASIYPNGLTKARLDATNANTLESVSSSGGATRPLIVSATTTTYGLMVVRGMVSSGGAGIGGETTAFTSTPTGTGLYTIGFVAPFTDAPVVTATLINTTGIIVTGTPTKTGFGVSIVNFSSAGVNSDFSFVAIGQRGV